MQLIDLIEEVKKMEYKVISFDLFDTLVKRPIVSATDMFSIMGNRLKVSNFMQKRMIAEKMARKNKPYYEDEVTLEKIYEEYLILFQDDITLKALVKNEVNVFLDYCKPRKAIKEVFNEALSAGKEVIIATDTYLDECTIRKILNNCGYIGYKKLYISSEENATKRSGRLYRSILADYSNDEINKTNILHIGDNKITDVQMAKQAGICVRHILSPIDVFKSREKLKNLLDNKEKYGDNNLLIGYLASLLFDNPYEIYDKQSVFDGNLKIMGEMVFGPFLLSFVKWMCDDMAAKNVDTICWVYRDGYLPQKIYKLLAECCGFCFKEKEIYLSRNMRHYFGVYENDGLWEKIFDLGVNDKMTLRCFTEKWLAEVNQENLMPIYEEVGYASLDEKIGSVERLYPVLDKLNDVYKRNCYIQAEKIKKYCNNILKDGKKIAVFDVGYRASVCEHLKKYNDIHSFGYHIFSRPVIKRVSIDNELDISSYIEFGQAINRKTLVINTILEQAISTMERGTAIGIDDNTNALIFEDAVMDRGVLEIQSGIMEFVQGFVKLFGKDILKLDFEGYQFFNLLVEVLCNPSDVDGQAISALCFTESKIIKGISEDDYKKWYNERYRQISKKEEKMKVITKREFVPRTFDECKAFVKKSRIDRFCFILGRIHLFKPARFIYRLGLKVCGVKNKDEIAEEENLNKMKELFEAEYNRAVNLYDPTRAYLFIGGDVAGFDKGAIMHHLELQKSIRRYCPNTDIFIISGVPRLTYEETNAILPFPFSILPKVAVIDQFDSNMNVRMNECIKNFYKNNSDLKLACDVIKQRYDNLGKNYAEALVYFTYDYLNKMLRLYKPYAAIMWNKYRTAYTVMTYCCKKQTIPAFFMEFGAVPGTFSIDVNGQMGESFPAIHSTEFLQSNITEEEARNNDEIMQFLKNSRLNRNVQPISNEKEKLELQILNGKKTLFYAGQNDFESGILPYTAITRRYHSPNFKSSDEACIFLADICKKNNWNLVYKPHPIMVKSGKCKKENLPDNVIYVSNIDINDVIDLSDAVITILSQTSYLALIREKPVIMLGYTQLINKGCTYEAFKREDVEIQIQMAFDEGYTNKQREMFYLHVAQMNKYYLYDDNLSRRYRFGMSVSQMADYIYQNI